MNRLALVAALSLAGCKTVCPVPQPPKIVKVEVVRYVGVPDELTEPCQTGVAESQTYAEAKRLALVRLEYLKDCNADKAKIRALSAQPEK